MSKDLRFAMLLDCYGEFLTPHQYRLTELYYCEIGRASCRERVYHCV